MYSPKVREKYVPVLYRLGRRRGVPMTRLVAEALDAYFDRLGLRDEVRAEAHRQLLSRSLARGRRPGTAGTAGAYVDESGRAA